MDAILAKEIVTINAIQNKFQIWEKFMLLLSEVGSPGTYFYVIFPLSYYIFPKAGLLVLWTACLSEYLNAILKWLLHGERPYWWLPQHKSLVNNRLKIRQFYLTCETSPGSPSGHCMVTAACWCVLVIVATRNRSRFLSWLIKGVFLIGVFGVGLSRCYIAAHFPHQVIAGTLGGILMGCILSRISFDRINPLFYLLVPGGLWVSAVTIRTMMDVAGMDPDWSESLAKKYCQDASWVHISKNLMASIIRSCAMLIGAYLALFTLRACFDAQPDLKSDKLRRAVGICLSLLVNAYLCHCVSLNETSVLIYYLVSAIRLILVPVATIVMVPLILKLTLTNEEYAFQTQNSSLHDHVD